MRRAAAILTSLFVLAGADTATAVKFERCGPKGFACAKVKVPLDHGRPGGPQIQLKVTRRRAADSKRRIGALFVNYGGPGGDAVKTTHGFGREVFAPFADRFDLVAIDPRGTGGSAGVSCDVNQVKAGLLRQPFVTPQTFRPVVEERRARFYADRCGRRNQRIAAHLSTANVARDFDLVRERLGYEKISYFGFSYGTQLGATYLRLFPQRARAFVLDGAVDPIGALNQPERNLRQQTGGFERSLERYFAACKRARGFCRWTGGRPPRKAYDALVRRADAKPIPARQRRITRGHAQPVDGDTINAGVIVDLYAKQFWPELTLALNQAKRGDASILRLLEDLFYDRKRGGGYGPSLDRLFMISASEAQYSRDLSTYARAGAASFRDFPHFFVNTGYSDLNFGVYEPRDEDAYLGPFALPGQTPTPLVVGTTFDPATPYAGAKALVRQLGHARLLTMRGDGHTAFGGNSPCIDRQVIRYIIAQELPRKGTRCRQRVPFPPEPEAEAATASAATAPIPVGPPILRRFGLR